MRSPGARRCPFSAANSLWWQYHSTVPSSRRTTVLLPKAPSEAVWVTTPGPMDRISAPSGAAKSSPECVLDHMPLEAPKRPVRWYPSTGSSHGGGLALSSTPLTMRYGGTSSGNDSEGTLPDEGSAAPAPAPAEESATAPACGAAASVVVVINPVRSTGVRA